ncbi:MAG: hypothetical protein QG608_2469 [Actinomycetota bacterium]|nr:hypothetical protein [Actinomycetota bacterium]
MFRISKKNVAVSTAVLLLSGGLAWAWNTNAGGSGSLLAGEAHHVTLSNDPIVNLWPSIDFTEIPVTYTNTNPGPVDIIDPQVEVAKVVDAAGVEVPDCTDNYFILQQIPAGTYSLAKTDTEVQAQWPHAKPSIRLRRIAPNACQGTTVELRYTSVDNNVTPPVTP